MKKVAVVGGRDFEEVYLLYKVLQNFHSRYGIECIISGGARGADTFAENWAKVYNIPTIIYYPDWNKYGRKAGLIRNSLIVNDCDVLIAFPTKNSRGTHDSIRKAIDAGKEVYRIDGWKKMSKLQ